MTLLNTLQCPGHPLPERPGPLSTTVETMGLGTLNGRCRPRFLVFFPMGLEEEPPRVHSTYLGPRADPTLAETPCLAATWGAFASCTHHLPFVVVRLGEKMDVTGPPPRIVRSFTVSLTTPGCHIAFDFLSWWGVVTETSTGLVHDGGQQRDVHQVCLLHLSVPGLKK